VSTSTLVLIIIAVCLAAFGGAFVGLGLSNERAYWSQRDPSGDPRTDATPLRAIIARAGHFATGEYRAPLRVAAIGILMCYLAIAFAIIGLITELV
jgi:hypothetical protein